MAGSYKLNRRNRLMDDWALRLYADPVNGSDKQPFMFFDFRFEDKFDGVEKVHTPHIGVNLRTEGKDNRLDFFTDPLTLELLFDQLEDLASANPAKDFYRIDLMTKFKFGKPLDREELDVGLVCARDGEGVFIGIVMGNRQNVKFYFAPPKMVALVGKDGQKLSNQETSILFTRAHVKILRREFAKASADYMDMDERKIAGENKRKSAFGGSGGGQGGGNRGGGGGNWNGGNNNRGGNNNGGNQGGGWGNQNSNGGNQSNPDSGGADFDNDIPF